MIIPYQSCIDNLVAGDLVEMITNDPANLHGKLQPFRLLVLGHWKLINGIIADGHGRVVPVVGIHNYTNRVTFYYPDEELDLYSEFPTAYCIPLWHTYHIGIAKIFKKRR